MGSTKLKYPRKQDHAPLPSNFKITRSRPYVQRLRRKPKMLRKYDAIIKEQVKRGIIERNLVESTIFSTKVHYISHQPVRKVKTHPQTLFVSSTIVAAGRLQVSQVWTTAWSELLRNYIAICTISYIITCEQVCRYFRHGTGLSSRWTPRDWLRPDEISFDGKPGSST